MSVTVPVVSVPTILHLSIQRFRGIERLSWYPKGGVNVILGGGDVGKTTILDAIGLLLSPTNPSILSDTDYFARLVSTGFVIEAVFSLPLDTDVNRQSRSTWPWEWNGSEAVVPSMLSEGSSTGVPVYKMRVTGNEEFDLSHEILQPDGSTEFFSAALRRAIGLVRLSGDDRNDRDLRLVSGSALDRLISDKGLRSRLTNELAKNEIKDRLTPESKAVLLGLDSTFREWNLPEGLDLAITGGQGFSIAALVGLTALRQGVQLPLSSWGAGTRRIAALTIAEQKQGDAPVTLVDEIERGLEPYRQRSMMDKLQEGKSQVFVTTHSPSAIAAASKATIWYVDHNGTIGPLEHEKIERFRKTDPETFLSRLTIVAEGATELGFVKHLLMRTLDSPMEKYGLHVTDGNGHESTLGLLEALNKGGLKFGGFADDEGKHPTRWQRLSERLDHLLFRWKTGCLEENLIGAMSEEHFEALLIDPTGRRTGQRLRSLADRLSIADKSFDVLKTTAGDQMRNLILEAAMGIVPPGKEAAKKEYESHAQTWFKTVPGGHELAAKTMSLGVWPTVRPQIMPFLNAVLSALHLPNRDDI
jgi:putative ATP-dependent endonuclease of OLD family